MKKPSRKEIKDIALVIAGTFVLCLSVEMFILPFDILSGGVAGIAVAVQPLTRMSATLIANILTLVLLEVGSLTLGRQFFLKTFLSSLCYPVFNSLLAKVVPVPDIDPVLASFYAGLLGGIGVGLVMRTGASTGGMDVPPLIVHKFTDIPVSTLVLITDGLTVDGTAGLVHVWTQCGSDRSCFGICDFVGNQPGPELWRRHGFQICADHQRSLEGNFPGNFG